MKLITELKKKQAKQRQGESIHDYLQRLNARYVVRQCMVGSGKKTHNLLCRVITIGGEDVVDSFRVGCGINPRRIGFNPDEEAQACERCGSFHYLYNMNARDVILNRISTF